MNFLAHAYLSFGDPSVTTGNLISDFVKGKTQYHFPERIQNGIRLHRAIDDFTDRHAATKEAAHFFKTPYRLYSGAIVDILYDHFLAADTSIFTDASLLQFTQQVYCDVDADAALLPARFATVFYYMKQDNWLWNYRTRAGIGRSLQGLVRRAAYLSESETAFALFEKHYPELQACYAAFLPDVKTFAKQQFEAQLR